MISTLYKFNKQGIILFYLEKLNKTQQECQYSSFKDMCSVFLLLKYNITIGLLKMLKIDGLTSLTHTQPLASQVCNKA